MKRFLPLLLLFFSSFAVATTCDITGPTFAHPKTQVTYQLTVDSEIQPLTISMALLYLDATVVSDEKILNDMSAGVYNLVVGLADPGQFMIVIVAEAPGQPPCITAIEITVGEIT